MLAGYIPFYHQFMKYDFQHALWREVFDAKGDQGQIKRVHAATQESCRQGLAGYQYDFKSYASHRVSSLKIYMQAPYAGTMVI
jgi:hypothetical protein